MRSKFASVVSLCLFACVAIAQTTKCTIFLQGGAIGTSEFSVKSDGTFESNSKLNIGGITMESQMSGMMAGGALSAFNFSHKQPGSDVAMTYKDGTLKMTVQGKTSERKLDKPFAAAFANFHPVTAVTLFKAAMKLKPGETKLPVLMVDSGNVMDVEVTGGGTKPIELARGKELLDTLELTTQGLPIDLAFTDKGAFAGLEVKRQSFKIEADGYTGVFADSISKFPELSQATGKSKVLKGVKIPMRDGVQLVADIALPDAEGKFPVILTRTPYGRVAALAGGETWAKRGYVFISQDCRGRFESGGEWNPFMNERKDGHDTIDWISKQPWCDGNVGMIGASYGGMVQWQAAVERHPALKCIVPQVSPPDMFYNIPYDFGTFMLYGNIWWSKIVADREANMAEILKPLPHPDKLGTLPLSEVDNAVLGRNVPFFDKWLEAETAKDFQAGNFQADMRHVKIPALHISGWFDGDGIGTKTNWAAMQRAGAKNQYLIYGPWTHAFNTSTKLGKTDFGKDAILDLDLVYVRWFDTWLKGKSVNLGNMPPVQVFEMGTNKWLTGKQWPLETTVAKTLYFSADEPANGLGSKGRLVESAPSVQEPSRYVYNPARVEIPEVLLKDIDLEGDIKMDLDKSDDSFLLFSTGKLNEPLSVQGSIKANLYFSTTAKDTDFFAIAAYVDEKGDYYPIALPGKIRCKYLSGFDNPKLLTPGKVYKAEIHIWDTACEIPKGHQFAIMIVSSSFPTFARNLNTGEPIKNATRMVTAAQTIYHDAKRPSSITFHSIKR